jgi:nicotinate-nucleotide adenylyltransferase
MEQFARSKRIGLLGGSFNPAHDGHVYISKQALELLGLDEIWWLVSPQNPLKEKSGMAPFSDRFENAKKTAATCAKILISDFEIHSKTTYTYETLCAIKAKYPDYHFVWLMGDDNLLQFPKWHRWEDIMELLPIAVFNRDGNASEILSCEVANKFSSCKIKDIGKLVTSSTPSWGFIDITPHPASSTKLRADKPMKNK